MADQLWGSLIATSRTFDGEKSMKQFPWMMVMVAGVWGFLGADPASAQGPYSRPQINNPYYRPPVSPYLNLSRGGNAGINYYGVVRPQLEYNSSIQQLQQNQIQEAGSLAYLANSGTTGVIPITGIRSQFMNFSHYYGGQVANVATLPPAISAPAVLPLAITPPLGQVNPVGINPRR